MRRNLDEKMHKLRLIVDSRLGTVHKCDGCHVFHATFNNVSIRLSGNQRFGLVDLVKKALELEGREIEIEYENKTLIN
jgi:hypothetical protein